MLCAHKTSLSVAYDGKLISYNTRKRGCIHEVLHSFSAESVKVALELVRALDSAVKMSISLTMAIRGADKTVLNSSTLLLFLHPSKPSQGRCL